MKKWVLSLCLLSGAVPAVAAGPEVVALADRSLWPDALTSNSRFDRASRAEMLVFAGALAEVTALDDTTLKAQLRIKQVDAASVKRVRSRMLNQLMANWKKAAVACQGEEPFCPAVSNVDGLLNASRELAGKVPANYQSWYDNALAFHRHYAGELIRLAALFPKTSSEIDTFSPVEKDGSELPDRHFLLTFDDGPTNRGGNTDTLLPLLDKAGMHATFYMLGERLSARLQQDSAAALQQKYAKQCTAMHGWQHQSHAKWSDWQNSVLNTRNLVKQTFPEHYRPWFRPPYGQRQSDSGAFFQSNGLGVALWNIDSQDWNNHVSASDAGQRVLTLMLLWRHGVILFHDIHPKAIDAAPWLLANTAKAGVVWEDCHNY